VLAATINRVMMALMMEAASTSETLVSFYQTTRRNNTEDSHLHIRRRENLKCHNTKLLRNRNNFGEEGCERQT
jgi:hypothetical protein